MQTAWASPIGRLLLEADDAGICGIRLLGPEEESMEAGNCLPLERAVQQLEEYFSGLRHTFDLPLSVSGSDFERSVWKALEAIPFGQTRTYGQIAAQLGRPGSARAIGRACSRNPLLVVVPCHRVIAASGALTGFAAGLDAKRFLLALEGRKMK